MNRSALTPLLMFVWLTVGYAAVHIAICSWAIGVWMAAWPDSVPYENLQIDEDGEPLISSWSRGNREQSFRRVDGTPVSDIYNMQQKVLTAVQIYPRPSGTPRSWASRITPFQDFQTPTTFWYHVEPRDRPGTSYFEGFEKVTRRCNGYIGLNGFSMHRPSVEQSFAIRSSQFAAAHGLLASAQGARGETVEPYYYGMTEWANVSPDTVWLLSFDTIYEIQLRSRTVRPLLQKQTGMLYLTQTQARRDEKLNLQLLVRTETGLLTFDPNTAKTEFIELQPQSPQSHEMYYQAKGGRRILVRTSFPATPLRSQQKYDYDITWIDEQGGMERHADTLLQNGGHGMPTAIFPVGIPAPIVAYGAWAIAPLVLRDHLHEDSTYSTRFVMFAAELWMWLLFSAVVGIATAWNCWRRESEVFGKTGWFWPILVGLCGWFGWLGYICVRPLPARLANGQWLTAQPEPNLPLGTEIFA